MKKFLLLYFFFLFFLLSLFSSGTVESQDGQQYLAVARYIYYEHWPSAPPYEYDKQLNIHMNLVFNPKDGKYYSGTGLGYSVALLPAVFVSDMVHRFYNIAPPQRFPLESDWVVLFVASFVNAGFGALVGVVMYLYLREAEFEHKKALLMSFLTVVATNISAYTKHGFAHLMFTVFLLSTFLFVKKSSKRETLKNLALAGVAFGITGLSYNPVFLFALPALIVYFFTLFPFSKNDLRSYGKKVTAVILGGLPCAFIYLAYNYIRLGSGLNSGYGIPVVGAPSTSLLTVLFESLWGFFFSSGRSIFIYSPLLLLPIIFWYKLQFKKWKPEALSFAVLITTFIVFYGTHHGEDWYGWAGESSWGPRYVMFLIPFGMFFVVHVWQKLTKKQLFFVGGPLLAISLYVQMLGVLLPYEIKFAGVPYQTYIGEVRLTTWDYGNFLPRFSPIVKQTKTLGKRILNFRSDHDHGKYNLRLFDGFEGTFAPWPKVYWRGMHSTAVASLESQNDQMTFELDFANTQTGSPSGYIARVRVRDESTELGQVFIEPEKWATLIATPAATTKKESLIFFSSEFVGTTSASQKVFLRGWKINGQAMPLQTLDQPYAQPLAEKMSGKPYYVWGKPDVRNWDRWHIRSSIYQNTFDLWWTRPIYYWDLPQKFLWTLFALDLIAVAYLTRKLLRFKVQ